MNLIKITGNCDEVVVSRDEEGREYLRALVTVRSQSSPDGVIEIRCGDPLVVNRFRCYKTGRMLFVVGELVVRDSGPPYIAASVVEYAHASSGFRPFNPIRIPAATGR